MKHKLPPWIARDQRERNLMIAWVGAQLDALVAEAAKNNSFGPGELSKYLALLAAWHGNMQPLHAFYPHLAPFLQAPKRGRGKYLRRRNFAVERAAAEVKIIRALWQRHYRKKNRRADDGPSAVEIAAERWGVGIAEVEKALK
jgi:hypothetical protein